MIIRNDDLIDRLEKMMRSGVRRQRLRGRVKVGRGTIWNKKVDELRRAQKDDPEGAPGSA